MYNTYKNNITSYDVSIGSWLDVEHLLQLVWIGLARPPRKKNASKQQQSRRNHLHFCAQYACIPGAAECDCDACKNVLRSILRLRATFGGQLNANRL